MSDSSDASAFYLTDMSPKDKPWDTHRAETQSLEELYKQTALFYHYADKLHQCSRTLEFGSEVSDTGELKLRLVSARYCRLRHCPTCQWRKTKVWYARFLKVLPTIMKDYPKGRWLFLTLTVKNCQLHDLRRSITQMSRAWTRLSQRKEFCALGWVKSLEITRAWDCYDGEPEQRGKYLGRHGLTWVADWERIHSRKLRLVTTDEVHPHFHVMMLVPSSYFTHKYVKHDRWVELWQDALRVDYQPWVHIRRVDWHAKEKLAEISNSRDEPPPKLGSSNIDMSGLTDLQKFIIFAVLEVLKYQVKPSELLMDMNPEMLDGLTMQLRGTRGVAIGGVLKKYLSEEEPTDEEMNKLGSEEESESDSPLFTFGWRENIKRYRKNA